MTRGGKIQVRSGRARRVSEAELDALPNMSKIRKKQLFGKDVTRAGVLLFKPKTAQQLGQLMATLSLEPELQKGAGRVVEAGGVPVWTSWSSSTWNWSPGGTTNLKARLAGILDKYGVSRRTPADKDAPPKEDAPARDRADR